MAASKRNFQDFNNKKEFNFFIEDGFIRFPTLYNIDTKQRVRVWDITIGLYSNNRKINILNDYINNSDIDKLKLTYDNLQVEFYTNTGIVDMKITKSASTIIIKGKNIGKCNETNIITQSLIDARSKYLKKIDTGYGLTIDKTNKNINKIPYPMALHKFNDHKHKLKFPCYIQPKLDGVRLISYYDSNNDEVVFKSRKLKDISGFNYIKKELKKKLKANPNIILDGELYCHGLNLQDISGIVRNEEKSATTNILNFNIFDCFDTANQKWELTDRILFINKILDSINYTSIVFTEEVDSIEQSDIIYKKYIQDGYEGLVYKNKTGIYKYSYNKEHRSYDNLKRKQKFDAEFKIVGYCSGTKGKAVGSIVFIMGTTSGKTFHVTPNVPYKEQQEMYLKAIENFDCIYKDKLATVVYDDLSKDGVPLRAKWIALRDYE